MNPDEFDLSTGWSRRGFLKGSGLLLAALGGAPVLSACGGVKGDNTVGNDGVLSIRTNVDVKTLDPAFLVAGSEDAILLCVAENLITYRSGEKDPVYELAEKLTSSKDSLSHEFTLKKGMQFHGGYGEVTAEDVKFSFERIAGLTKPDIHSTYQGDWATLKEVEVTGTYTGVIKLKKPFAPLMYTTLPGNAGVIISKAAYEKLDKEFATHPVGSGPFEFVEWKRGQYTLLRRFDKWGDPSQKWAGKPQWKQIKFVPIAEDRSADVAVETHEVDMGEISYSSVKRFEKNRDFTVTTLPTLDYSWIGFNVKDPKLSDVRVRRALRQALDVDSMLEAAFAGEARRAYALIAPDMSIGYWKDAPRYKPDVAAAKRQLQDAGVSGLSLQFAIGDGQGDKEVAEIVQQNLSKIGVEVSIKKYLPGRPFVGDRVREVFGMIKI